MRIFYVHKSWANAVFVKTEAFFKDQGGLTEDWGKGWTPIGAESIEDARERGKKLLPDNPLPYSYR